MFGLVPNAARMGVIRAEGRFESRFTILPMARGLTHRNAILASFLRPADLLRPADFHKLVIKSDRLQLCQRIGYRREESRSGSLPCRSQILLDTLDFGDLLVVHLLSLQGT